MFLKKKMKKYFKIFSTTEVLFFVKNVDAN
jgi:hypothetical protein